MIKKIFTIFFILTAIEFYSLTIIGQNVLKIFDIICITAAVIILIIDKIKEKLNLKEYDKKIFAKGIIIILLSVFLSFAGAEIYHQQSLFISFISSRFMYFYLLYFLLIIFNIKISELEKILTGLSILYSIIYLLAMFYPNIVSANIQIDLTRDTTRVYIPGILLVILSLFNHLLKLKDEIKIKDLIYVSLFLTIVVITGTRMIIFPLLFLIIFFSFSMFKLNKPNFYIWGLTFGVVFLLILLPIVVASYELLLVDLQYSSGSYEIRLKAISYFINEFFPSFLSYIIGNGFASYHDNYGLNILFLKENFHFYQSDIGLIGDYTKFGILYIVGVFIILFRVFKSNFIDASIYLKYFFIFIAITCITLSHFGFPDGIVSICCGLYLLQKYSEDSLTEDSEIIIKYA